MYIHVYIHKEKRSIDIIDSNIPYIAIVSMLATQTRTYYILLVCWVFTLTLEKYVTMVIYIVFVYNVVFVDFLFASCLCFYF